MSASAGKVLLTPQGDYNAITTYSILDWVRYNGGVYVAKQTTTGNLPTDTTYWEKMIDSVSTLSGLTDVNITNIADGETLIWDATNSEWVNGTITGGGSYITLTTTTEQGENVSMSIGGATYTGVFSAQGVCTFEGVKETGTGTATTANASAEFVIEYFGAYTIDVSFIPKIYGVYWDGTSSPAMTRTDAAADFTDPIGAINNGNGSSPFDDIMPWAGMERVEDANAGTLVKIPKFWYKLNIDDTTGEFSLKISPEQQDGFYVSPAHANRGDGHGERDYVYVGAYKSVVNTYKSQTNITVPNVSGYTREQYRSSIHALGTDIWQWDLRMLVTIWMLYIVEFANWNSQEKIGNGGANTSLSTKTGATDSMEYCTGTSGTSRETSSYSRVRYRYIEDMWGFFSVPIDGIYMSSDNGGARVIANPANFSDSSGGIYDGFTARSLSSNTPKKLKQSKVSGLEWYFAPMETIYDSTYATYLCDNMGWANSENAPYVMMAGSAPDSNGNTYSGIFYVYFSSSTGNKFRTSRLMKLPNN